MIDPEKRLWRALRASCRRTWCWYSPARKACLAAAKSPAGVLCAECGGRFRSSEVAVDHVVPCGKLRSLRDLPGFAKRLFGGRLQVLCDKCHDAKSAAERKRR